MSTTLNPPDLRSWLAGKTAGAPPAGTNGTKQALELPPDGGKTPSTGERFSENTADAKKLVNEGAAEGAAETSEFGSSKNVLPNSGLEQTIAGQGDSQTGAIKKIEGENEKIAKIDLSTPGGIDEALARLDAAQKAIKLAAAPPAAAGQPAPTTDKSAAEKAAEEAVYRTTGAYIKWGADRALITARYLDGFTQTYEAVKRAVDDGSMAAMLAQGGGAPGGGGDAPPPDAAAAAAAPPMPPGGGGDAPPPADGASPEAMAGGMGELNLTPEQIQEIIALLQGQLAQAGAGASPPPPEAKAAAEASLKRAGEIVKAAADHMRSGKFRLKPAADGSPERRSRDEAKNYLRELLAAGGR